MKEPYCYLGVDVGTTGVKAVLFDGSGAELGAAILGAAARGDFDDPGSAAAGMVRIARVVEPGKDRAVYRECFKNYRKLNDLMMPTFGGNL